MQYKLCAVILLLVLVSGCTSVRDQGIVLSLQADPSPMFSQSSTLLHIDVDNRNQKTISNVVVNLFDAGLLFGQCAKYFERLLPYEFQSVACQL